MKYPRVLHIVISLDHGGLERQIVLLTQARNRAKVESTYICCLDDPGALAGELAPDEVMCVQAHRHRFPYDKSAVRNIRQLIADRQIDVVHSHNLAAQQYAVLATKGVGVGHIHTQHGPNPHNDGLRDRWRIRWLRSHTDKFVAVSENTRSVMLARGMPSDRTLTISNCIDTDRFVPVATPDKARRTVGIPEGSFVVGTVARFTTEKNLPLLVAAFSLFSRHCPSAFLVLVGDGPEMPAVERAVRDGGIEGRCLIPGLQSDTVPWLSAMSVFCLSSNSEGTPVALLEAGAMVIPAVVTHVGGNAEIVQNGVNGFVVKANNCNEFSDALSHLYRDAPLRKRMGIEARRIVEERYSLDRTLASYEEVYETVFKIHCQEQKEGGNS